MENGSSYIATLQYTDTRSINLSVYETEVYSFE